MWNGVFPSPYVQYDAVNELRAWGSVVQPSRECSHCLVDYSDYYSSRVLKVTWLQGQKTNVVHEWSVKAPFEFQFGILPWKVFREGNWFYLLHLSCRMLVVSLVFFFFFLLAYWSNIDRDFFTRVLILRTLLFYIWLY